MNTEIEKAWAVAIKYLGYSARTSAELQTRLARDNFSPEVIAKTLEQCQSRGFIDDAAFADAWVADRADRKRYGKARLGQELRRKGIPKDTLVHALETVEPDDEFRRALAACESKWNRVAAADPATRSKEKQRVSSFLQRRGFGWSTIKQVFDVLMANELEG